MRFAVVFVIVFVIIIVGGVVLQIFLSTRKNGRFGLILPIVSLIIAFSVSFGATAYKTKITTRNYDENGNITEERVDEEPMNGNGAIPVIFLLYNIPTAVLTVIYLACRETVKKNSELNKMNIQDLE